MWIEAQIKLKKEFKKEIASIRALKTNKNPLPHKPRKRVKNKNNIILPIPKWFVSNIGSKVELSSTELRIHQTLNSLNVNFSNEVSFVNIKSQHHYYRFDFYLPELKTVIEYDGEHHRQKTVKYCDRIKNSFCKKHGIRIKRFNNKNWETLEIDVLMFIRSIKG